MRGMVIVVAVLAFAHDAYADAKTQKLAAGYQRQARNCKIQGGGVTKVLEGATAMQAESDDAALAADIVKLRAASEPIEAYCGELAAVIELLKADPAAPYKSLEAQIIERDKKISELRKAFKQATDSVTPIIRRLVPRINKRNAEAGPSKPAAESAPTKDAGPAPQPAATLPPALAPTPKPVATPPPVKITDGPTTSISVRAFTGGTCDEQARKLDKAEAWTREPPKKRPAGALAWLPNARWIASYVAGDRLVQIECVPTKTGGMILTLEGPSQPRSERELLELAARALAATAKP